MDRECTDVCWLVFFILMCLAMMGMVLFAVAAGNGTKWLSSFDAAANLCGYAMTGEELKTTMVWNTQEGACFT